MPTTMSDLSTTESANTPAGSSAPSIVDNEIRALASILRHTQAKGTDIASASTTNIGAATGEWIDITGTTTITSFGTVSAGILRKVRFISSLTLTYNATSMILPTSANIQTRAGDTALFASLGSGNWICMAYQRRDGTTLFNKGVSVAANATTSDIWSGGDFVTLTGTAVTFTDVADSPVADRWVWVRSNAAHTITNNANITVQGGATITIANGDLMLWHAITTTTFEVFIYKLDGQAVVSNNKTKLESITASVSTGALTITFNGGLLDFRSPTLTTGTPLTVNVASNDIVIPSTSSLGTTTATSARIAVLEAYNGGTPVICVVNVAGGVPLDETNLISPTNVGASSNSASTIYSDATVSSNSPYRVVGIVDAVWTSGTGWSTPTLAQPVGGQVKTNKVDAVRVHTDNGAGSTNTAIRRFLTTDYAIGTAITYADSATNGATFTINERGLYAITFTDNFSAAAHMGISRNSAQLTTAVNSINTSDCLAQMFTTSGNGAGCVAGTFYLEAGDVIRAHCGVSLTNGTASGETFAITKVLSL